MFNKTKHIASAFLVAALAMPMVAQATNVTDYMHMDPTQRATLIVDDVSKIIADIKPVSPALAKNISDHFYEKISTGDFAGIAAFKKKLKAELHMVKDGKMKLDDIDIEAILRKVIGDRESVVLTQEADGTVVASDKSAAASAQPATP